MTNSDKIKGKAKQALGDVTGDAEMKREGDLDRAAGSAKETVERVKNKIKDALHR